MQRINYEFNEEGIVSSIQKGVLRDLYVVNIKCQDININLDVTSEINIFNNNEKVNVIISRSKPIFTSNDFCGHGYIVTEKVDQNAKTYITIISLFGLLVKIESNSSFLNKYGFNVMDHVYFCILKET
ncbi:DNA-directed RNA polymerase subunit G [Acidianus sp. HS-5]|uniref:DNA-directed RNA polymerase subunit G n=1 Tax=Acidianus sp. HS-5 TaxID=2886040 RepID=UPI001F37DBC4|nr:DNA-directed RNA polymerase subunit G [Acidianus sp. HS-5]BDC19285.1 hypothetical protein HS5_21750 [Acidianus sp. HS-5]